MIYNPLFISANKNGSFNVQKGAPLNHGIKRKQFLKLGKEMYVNE